MKIKNWKTTVLGLTTALFAFVFFSPQYFPVWLVDFAKFAALGGLAGLGIAAKDLNVTGGKRKILGLLICMGLLGASVSCAKRVEIKKPDGSQIIINDRVVDLWDSKTMEALIIKLPPDAQKDAVRELIAAKERLATAAIQREKDRGLGWLEALKTVLNWAAAAGVAAVVK